MRTATQHPSTRTRLGYGLFSLAFLLYAFTVGGSLYQTAAEVPNWAGNIPDGLQAYQNFFKVSHAGYYFRIIGPIEILSLVGALLLLRNRPRKANNWLLLALGGVLAVEVATVAYFLPRNFVLFLEPLHQVPAEELVRLGNQWVTANYLRLGLTLGNFLVFMRIHSLLSAQQNPAPVAEPAPAAIPHYAQPVASY